jgi:hypothetical protein
VDRRDLEAPGHRAGVAVPTPLVRLAQVGVRVDLEHPQAGVTRRGGAHGADADRVLPAERDDPLPVVEQRPDALLDGAHGVFGRPPGEVERRGRPHAAPERLEAQLLVEQLELLGDVDDACGPPAAPPPPDTVPS